MTDEHEHAWYADRKLTDVWIEWHCTGCGEHFWIKEEDDDE